MPVSIDPLATSPTLQTTTTLLTESQTIRDSSFVVNGSVVTSYIATAVVAGGPVAGGTVANQTKVYTDAKGGGPIAGGTSLEGRVYPDVVAGGPRAGGSLVRGPSSYTQTRSGGPIGAGSITAELHTSPKRWAPPDGVDDIWLAHLAFPEAQRLLGAGAPTGTARLAICGWHGTSVDNSRGSYALAKQGGPLADLVGKRIRISVRTDPRRAVYAYVSDTANVLEDMTVSRRLFAGLALLAAGEVPVLVEEETA